MKLYLSSVGIPDPQAFKALMPNSDHPGVAVISDAWAVYPAEKAKPFIESVHQALESLGCQVEQIQLHDYIKRTNELKQRLQALDALWVTGGNVFYLNWVMRQSGFDQIIKGFLESGLVYGGESAGASVAGPTIRGAQHMDDPAQAPGVLWDGLGLVKFGLVPHWGKAKYAGRLEQFADELGEHVLVKTVEDSQALVVDGLDIRYSKKV